MIVIWFVLISSKGFWAHKMSPISRIASRTLAFSAYQNGTPLGPSHRRVLLLSRENDAPIDVKPLGEADLHLSRTSLRYQLSPRVDD